MAGKMQELATEVPKMVQDLRYAFVDFETELSKTGFQLLNSGRDQEVQVAIQVFTFITQLFPNSAEVWKNLAEGYLKAGDKDKAIEFLNKAISLSPNGEIGKGSKEMLKEIKS